MSKRRLLIEVIGSDAAPVELPRGGALSIGSSDRADLVVAGQGVADVHCAIGRVKGGGWALKDLGSEYGTIVGGKKVQSVRLEAGDQIVLGSRRLRIVEPGAEPVPEPEPPARPPAREEAQLVPEPPAPSPLLPQVVGYRVEKPLGRGGMGAVFLAVQQSLERRVALKILNPKLAADADFVARFLAEARAAAALSHPNVVTVHDVWEDGGRHLLSMEYMERGNLESRIAREGRMAPREVLDILADASKGLVYAELRGIVHRDIKPANLMQDELGHTKIADLGLATHLEAEVQDAGSTKIFGTPHFISPEQARGERVDCRSDLYSLGATCYRLLTGHTPFEGATTRDILRGHFTEQPRPVRELAPEVPEALARAVERLLEKDPAARFPSASVLLQETERMRSSAAAPAAAPLVQPRARRGPLVLVGAAVLILVALAVGLKILGGGAAESDEGGVVAAGGADPEPAPEPRVDPEGAGPDGTGVRPVDDPEEPPVDDDAALKRLEAEAREEWTAWKARATGLEYEVQREELLEIAGRHPGTTAAAEMTTEVQRLEGLIRSDQKRATRLAGAADDALRRMQAAAAPGGNALPLARALPAMLAVQVDGALQAEPEFQAARAGLLRETVASGYAAARQELERLEALADEGRFDELETGLTALVARVELPELEGLTLEMAPELGDLRGLRALAARRLTELDAERERYRIGLEHGDAKRIAAGCAGPAGLERELRALDFGAAETRLAALEAELRTEEPRAFVARLRADLGAGRKALGQLGRDFSSWRRKSIDDPRGRGRTVRTAVGADAQGVRLDVGGQVEEVRWAAFGGSVDKLHQLFYGRLERHYSAEELAGIEALLRITAVVEALEEAAEVMDGGGRSRLTDGEMEAMLAGFALADEWAAEVAEGGALDRERRAVRLLARSLRATSDEAWSSAVADLERLLQEYRDTLLVRMISDGRPWQTPPALPVTAPTTPPTKGPDEPEDGD